jgi:hypothetical protein
MAHLALWILAAGFVACCALWLLNRIGIALVYVVYFLGWLMCDLPRDLARARPPLQATPAHPGLERLAQLYGPEYPEWQD